MGNCLVTKLKGTVNNDSLVKVDELRVDINCSNSEAIRLVYLDLTPKTIRALSSNVQLSADNTNWSSSVTVTPDNAGEAWNNRAVVYVKTDGNVGSFAVSDKFNLAAVPSSHVGNMFYLVCGDYSMLTQLRLIHFGEKDKTVDIADFNILLNVQFAKRTSLGNKNYGMVRYTRNKQSGTRNFFDMSDCYFENISQCVDFLEDAAAGGYTRYNDYHNLRYDENASLVTFSDERLAPYKTRLYDALLAICQKLTGVWSVFGVSYTVENGKLYGNGEEIII